MCPLQLAPTPLEGFLRETIGLDIETIGPSSIDRALGERMQKCRLTQVSDYLDRLKVSGSELDELVERIVVPETWFFRDEKPFQMLQKYVIEEWLPRRSEPLRLLSIPCSTGEEPYSLAMALLDTGLGASRIRIDACDICHSAVDKARRAVYGRNSFRNKDLSFRARYFDAPVDGAYTLKETVRRVVSFSCENLFDPSFAQNKGSYDVIFFRNLMIYLSRDYQERALALIDRLLAPSGLLFVGHAEPSPLMDRWFRSVRYPSAFAFRKRSDERRKPQPAHDAKPAIPFYKRRVERRQEQVSKPSVRSAEPPVRPSSSPQVDGLEAARRFADQGKLEEAFRLCEESLRTAVPTAEAYYLLGLINSAWQRESAAEECFQKAVYLEPNHYQALAHLALAAEKRRDRQAADIYRQRARRAEQRLAGKQT